MMPKEDLSGKNNPRINGEYWKIASEAEKGACVFCDRSPKYVVVEEENCFLTANLFPYIDGQLIVVPTRHVEDYFELTDEEVIAAHRLIKLGMSLLKDELKIDNVWQILRNGNVAGKTVRHLHWNILPYIEGLNTWNYQDITIQAGELSERLRERYGRTNP